MRKGILVKVDEYEGRMVLHDAEGQATREAFKGHN